MRIRDDWRERLGELVDKAGGNRKSISVAAKLNETYVRDILDKGQTPQLKSAEKLSRGLNASITAWFLAPSDEDTGDLEAVYAAPAVAEGYIPIGRFDTSFSMGPGSLIEERPVPLGYMVFEEQWVRTLSAVAPAHLAVVKVDGDSMMPTLHAGDLVLIDRTKTKPNREGIYAIRVGDIAWVKRVSINLKTQKIRVLSDNPLIPKQPEMDEDDLAILGRVIALVARKMP